jgi:YbgC/YbaW family acyl-CoA thioester hydrolase
VLFEQPLRVRFHQADPAGVLFYGRVFELVEETYEAFCQAIGLDIDAMMRMVGLTTPVVHGEVDFREPLAVGESLVVRVGVAHVGGSSYTLVYSLVGHHGRVSATAKVTHVVVDAPTWSKQPIPDDLRARLAPYALETAEAP